MVGLRSSSSSSFFFFLLLPPPLLLLLLLAPSSSSSFFSFLLLLPPPPSSSSSFFLHLRIPGMDPRSPGSRDGCQSESEAQAPGQSQGEGQGRRPGQGRGGCGRTPLEGRRPGQRPAQPGPLSTLAGPAVGRASAPHAMVLAGRGRRRARTGRRRARDAGGAVAHRDAALALGRVCWWWCSSGAYIWILLCAGQGVLVAVQ